VWDIFSDQSFEININATLNDNAEVYDAQVGDIINCSANGYPKPFVNWVNSTGETKNATDEDAINGKGWELLNLTEPGTQEWRCTATNIASQPDMISEKYTFQGCIGNYSDSDSRGMSVVVLTLATADHVSLGWPWVEVIAACAHSKDWHRPEADIGDVHCRKRRR